jgi:hypothetical protein
VQRFRSVGLMMQLQFFKEHFTWNKNLIVDEEQDVFGETSLTNQFVTVRTPHTQITLGDHESERACFSGLCCDFFLQLILTLLYLVIENSQFGEPNIACYVESSSKENTPKSQRSHSRIPFVDYVESSSKENTPKSQRSRSRIPSVDYVESSSKENTPKLQYLRKRKWAWI